MYAVTSPYKRKTKGGTRARQYVCANSHGATGLCDLPRLDAERIDRAVVAYLDGLFVNLDAWHAELARARDGRRAGIESELGRHRERLERAVRREGKLRERWLEAMDRGDPLREQLLSEAHRGLIEEREDARRAVERLEPELDAEPAPAADAMLDAWSDLRDAVRNGGDSLGELNARLRTEFLEFRMDLMEDGVVGIRPILRERPSPASGISYDEAMARPLLSYEDYLRMQREKRGGTRSG